MEFSFTIPEGYYLEGLGQHSHGTLWMAYLRKVDKSPRIGAFVGQRGRTPQEAIDKAWEYLESRKDTYAIAYNRAMNEELTSDDLDF